MPVKQDNSQTMPLISFIITYYNLPPAMLRECVGSIAGLNLNRHEREIILVDDGSAANPMDYLEEWCSDIIYIRQENSGLSAARNTGISAARGDYLQFVDGDDMLIKTGYDKCIEILKANKPDMLMFLLTNSISANNSQSFSVTTGIDYMLHNNIRSTACGYLFRKDILGGHAFTCGTLHEDDEFTPLLMLKAKSLADTTINAYWYRERANSITTNNDKCAVQRRLDHKRDGIFRLQHACLALDDNQREALDRRIAQLAMDYIYTIIMDDKRSLPKRLGELRQHALYPLPNKSYTSKYKWFRIISGNKLGIRFLSYSLPLIKRER